MEHYLRTLTVTTITRTTGAGAFIFGDIRRETINYFALGLCLLYTAAHSRTVDVHFEFKFRA